MAHRRRSSLAPTTPFHMVPVVANHEEIAKLEMEIMQIYTKLIPPSSTKARQLTEYHPGWCGS
jgi:hypothetical protein